MIRRFCIVMSAPALPFNMLRSNTNLAVRESTSMLNLHVTHFGRNTNNAANAGGFYWNLNNDSSNLNRNIGTHHVSWILDGGIPEEHKAQMTLQAAVTGRSWVDFVSYDPRMPEPQQLLVRRFYPTAGEMVEIEVEAEKFLAEVDVLFDTITRREMIE